MLKLAALVLLLLPVASQSRDPYDEHANARAEVDRMLQCARDEGKPLLVMFGANWCPWCRDLDQLLASDRQLSAEADRVFLRLNVDIGQYDRNLDLAAGYGLSNLDDTGIPMLVILSPDGSVRATKNSDDFVVRSRYSRDRIRRFLDSYARH
jgi:protein disulfide-isomerase